VPCPKNIRLKSRSKRGASTSAFSQDSTYDTDRQLGSYHYLSGIEASSSASLAAYINSLQFHIEEPQAWFATKGSLWHVGGGTYCCFNAFSRVDMRVDVRIPGGVEGYVVDLRGERYVIP
jgi:hypothetical protein